LITIDHHSERQCPRGPACLARSRWQCYFYISPKQPAAGWSRGPHGGVGAGCESVTEQLDQRV